MANAKSGWSYSAGERGRNRVRAFEHPSTGLLFLEFYEQELGGGPRRKRVALGHRDRTRGKQQADELAARFGSVVPAAAEALTLQKLFDIYLREVTPTKGASKQGHDRRCATMFLDFFGRDRRVATLSRRDWDRFIHERRRGAALAGARVGGRPVRDTQVRHDVLFLRAVLNWATMAGDGRGGALLESNPLRGLPAPREESPCRPVLEEEQYRALLAIADRVSPQFGLALLLAHETGHRIGAIQQLRWSDVNLKQGVIRWRAENDKIGFEHAPPLSEEAVRALEQARRASAAIGDAWLFPNPADASRPISRHVLWRWWALGEQLAGIEHVDGLGYHSLRRKFATELKGIPLKDLCQLGGWKDPQTILKCYQRPDEDTMRHALAERHRTRLVGRASDTANRHHEASEGSPQVGHA